MARNPSAKGSNSRSGAALQIGSNKKVTGAIDSALRRKQYDERGYKYDKTIKANPKVETVSKIKTRKVGAKSGGATTVKGAKPKAQASAGANKSIISKPGSPGKKSTKTEKIKVTRKKTTRTKSEAKEAKISARQTVRKTNKAARQDMRKKNRAEKDPKKRLANKVATQKANAKSRKDMRANKKVIKKSIKK